MSAAPDLSYSSVEQDALFLPPTGTVQSGNTSFAPLRMSRTVTSDSQGQGTNLYDDQQRAFTVPETFFEPITNDFFEIVHHGNDGGGIGDEEYFREGGNKPLECKSANDDLFEQFPCPSNSLVAMLSRPQEQQQQQQQHHQHQGGCTIDYSPVAPMGCKRQLPEHLPSLSNSAAVVQHATPPAVVGAATAAVTPPVPLAPVPNKRGSVSSTASNGSNSSNPTAKDGQQPQFKPVQEEKWIQRLSELRTFRSLHGHCLVPHQYKANPQLARWVKRQRRQHKLLREGKSSTLSADRVRLLEDVGFVWDSHSAGWNEKMDELRSYRERNGNCLVPSTYKANPQLAIWVKCQRRQYKLWRDGRSSSMTAERAAELEREGFCFEVRTASASANSANLATSPAEIASSAAANAAAPPSAVVSMGGDPTDLLDFPPSNGGDVPNNDLKLLFESISQL